MKYLAGWPGGGLFGDKWLLWSGQTVLLGGALWTDGDSTGLWPLAYLYVSNFKHWPQKILLVEKKWLVEK